MNKPAASSQSVSARMSSQATKNTQIEILIRRALFALGLRYRIHQSLLKGSRREVDIVFPKARVAIFVDGCYWHCCPEHGSIPRANRQWWEEKLNSNKQRDRDTNERLEQDGWRVIRVWEHEDPVDAARAIAEVVTSRS